MKVRELIERLQTMEQDATVTVLICNLAIRNNRARLGLGEVRIENVRQHGAGVMATACLDPEDELKLA